MTELHEQLKLAFAVYVRESEKFENEGVKVSAVRARQALSDINKLIAARRKEIQTLKDNT
jgi:hypothetical protein